MSGLEKQSGSPLTLLYLGSDATRSYLEGQVFSDNRQRTALGRTWPWNIGHRIRVHRPDLAIVEFRRHFSIGFSEAGWLRVPRWIRGEVALPLSPEVVRSACFKSDLRRIRRSGFGHSVSQDPDMMRRFYDTMHVPHIRRVHGKNAVLLPYSALRQRHPNGKLMLIEKAGEPVAAMFFEHTAERGELIILGVTETDSTLRVNGVIAALYQFTFRYLEERGIRTATLGHSRSFLNDGAFRYKQKLGQRIAGQSTHNFLLRVCRPSGGASAFLERSPCIVERNGHLCTARFVTEADVESSLDAPLPEVRGIDTHLTFRIADGGITEVTS